MKIFFIFIFFIAGIVTGNFSISYSQLTVFISFSLIFLFCSFLWIKKNESIVIICILIFVFGYLSIQERVKPDLPSHHISSFLNSKDNILTGKVVSFAKHYKRKYKVTLLCQTIRQKKGFGKTSQSESYGELQKITGRIKLSIYGSSDKTIRYGDIIRFKSSLKSIRNFQNPGGFDYKRFLKLQGIYASAWSNLEKIEILTDKKESTINFFDQIIRKLENLRVQAFYLILNKTGYSDSGKILASLVTGKKEIIPHSVRDLFSKAGISHLLAISGLHLSIVSFLFFFIFYRAFSLFPTLLISGKSKKIAGLFTIVPLILYGVFTGFSPSCQRALIMIIVLIFAFIREKEKDIISSLSFAGIIILIVDSAALFSISFQLSFAAIIFIIYGVSLLEQYFPDLVGKKTLSVGKKIWSKLCMMGFVTLFAGLGTSALTAHYFNVVSVMAPLSNFIAIPILGFIVLPLGLVCLLCFLWLPAFAGFIIVFCAKLISYVIVFSQFIISIPFAWSRTITLQLSEIVVIYLIFVSIFLILKGYKKTFVVTLSTSFLLIIFNFINPVLNKIDKNSLQITVIDVGQGNSTLIQTPGGKNILVDGGGFSDLSSFDTGKYIIAPFLWKKRIKTIDYIVLSHPEADHLNGLIFILDNFNVKTLIKNNDKKKTYVYDIMMQVCKKHNIKIVNPLDNMDKNFDLGKIRFKFFEPSNDLFSYNFNNNSLVFKLIYKDFSMLFPGDILKQREEQLCLKPDVGLKSDLMLAPHHGSNSSSTKNFLEKVMPESVLISCGFQNKYHFPDKRVLKRYKDQEINIYRTDLNGAVFVLSDGSDYKIKTFIKEN